MIVKSILDTDLYKFTTSYAYMKLFPQARGTFEFFDRDLTEYPVILECYVLPIVNLII